MVNAEASGNAQYHSDNAQTLKEVFERSPKSFYQTKVLESTLDTTGESYVQAPDQIVLNEWLHLVSMNVYRRTIEYTPPGASVPLVLTQQQAVALWIYAICRVLEPVVKPEDYELINRVPQIGISNVLKSPSPSLYELEQLVDPTLLSSEEIQQYLDLVTPVPALVITTTGFEQYCSRVFANGYDMYRLYSYKQHPLGRAMGQMVSESLYINRLVSLPQLTETHTPSYRGVTYAALFEDINFAASNYSRVDYYEMVSGIFNLATGVNLSLASDPANIQEAMVSLMRMLSSYSIAIVYNKASTHAIASNHPDVRVAEWPLKESYQTQVDAAAVSASLSAQIQDQGIFIDLNKLFPPKKPDMVESISAKIQLNPTGLTDFKMESTEPGRIVVRTNITTSFDPIASFDALSLADKNKILSLQF